MRRKYLIAQVAQQTGVSAATLRNWESRYGFLSPERSQGRQRSYTERDLEKIRRIKALIDAGMRPSQVLAQLQEPNRLVTHKAQGSSGSMISRMCYVSRSTNDMSLNDLCALASKASATNSALQVSGALTSWRGYFVQMLEGPPEVISQLVAKIFSDSRHAQIVVLEWSHQTKRLFSEWGMHWVSETKITQALKALLSDKRNANPACWTPALAIRLLSEGSAKKRGQGT